MKMTKENFLSLLLIFLICLASFFLILEIINLNKIVLGLKVANLRVGGLKINQAEVLLKKHFEKWQNQEIELIYGARKFFAQPEEIGIQLDLEKTLNLVYNFGREKNILLGLYQQLIALLPLSKNNLSPVYSFDQEKFHQFIKEKFKTIESPAKNATLVFDRKTNDWQVIPSEKGLVVDRKKLKEDLEKLLLEARLEAQETQETQETRPLQEVGPLIGPPKIELNLVVDYPEVKEEETEIAKIKANQILNNAPYFLKLNGKSWLVDKETLLDWFEFVPDKILGLSFNQEKIKDTLISLAPSINQEPINAQLTIVDGKVVAFALSQEGIKLEIEKSSQKIAEGLLTFSKEIELVVIKTQPQITSQSIDTLGLTSLLGKGLSNFSGSPKNRIHNIKVGTAKFNGILLKPNEEFSFNTILEEIGPAQGYLPELVIKKNKTIPEYGGGLCQVSTTVFRAAVLSGLKITERYAHAFPVKYYSPQGFDATIYPPHPDLRFINDTAKNLLIQSKVEGNNLIFEFYGTDDDRDIKIKGPIILESKPDGSMKTILYQEIWRNDSLERQDKFISNYKSPALYPVERNPLE